MQWYRLIVTMKDGRILSRRYEAIYPAMQKGQRLAADREDVQSIELWGSECGLLQNEWLGLCSDQPMAAQARLTMKAAGQTKHKNFEVEMGTMADGRGRLQAQRVEKAMEEWL